LAALRALTIELEAQLSDQLALGPAETRILLGDDQNAVPAPAGSLLCLRVNRLRLMTAEVAAELMA
jgi:hypothetical protein